MTEAEIRLILEVLRLAKEFGADYVEKKIKESGRKVISEGDLEVLVRYDTDPGNVFDNK